MCPPAILLFMDPRRRAVWRHRCAQRGRCGRVDLPGRPFAGGRVETYRTAGADHVDALSSRRPTALVCLFGSHQRTILRAAPRRAVCRRRIVRMSMLFWPTPASRKTRWFVMSAGRRKSGCGSAAARTYSVQSRRGRAGCGAAPTSVIARRWRVSKAICSLDHWVRPPPRRKSRACRLGGRNLLLP